MTPSSAPSLARRVLDALLLLAALAVVAQLAGGSPRVALAAQAGGAELFALTAPGQAHGSNVLYVIDPRAQRLLVFEHRVAGKLELTHVRQLELDVQLEEVGEHQPAATQVKKALDKLEKKRLDKHNN